MIWNFVFTYENDYIIEILVYVFWLLLFEFCYTLLGSCVTRVYIQVSIITQAPVSILSPQEAETKR